MGSLLRRAKPRTNWVGCKAVNKIQLGGVAGSLEHLPPEAPPTLDNPCEGIEAKNMALASTVRLWRLGCCGIFLHAQRIRAGRTCPCMNMIGKYLFTIILSPTPNAPCDPCAMPSPPLRLQPRRPSLFQRQPDLLTTVPGSRP